MGEYQSVSTSLLGLVEESIDRFHNVDCVKQRDSKKLKPLWFLRLREEQVRNLIILFSEGFAIYRQNTPRPLSFIAAKESGRIGLGLWIMFGFRVFMSSFLI